MPFQFDPTEYKNKFLATVISSVIEPSPNDPTKEMWSAILLRVKANPTRTDWEAIDSGIVCQLPGCVSIKPWHTHARWFESDRQFSPAHKFVESIKDKGKTDPGSGPNSILNKTYVWEEEIVPERRNPNTGGMYKEQRNYYIAGVAEFGQAPSPAPANTNGEASGELPWDAPTTQPVTTVVAPTVSASAPVAVAAPATYEEGVLKLAELVDGKNKEEVRQLIVGTPELRNVPGLLLKFVRGDVITELKETDFITEDEGGVYHIKG